MFDSSTLPTEDIEIKLILKPIHQLLLRDYQKNHEELFNKFISYEDIIFRAVFFTNNINTIKLAILSTYEQNGIIIPNDSSNQANTNHITKNTTKELSDKKRAIAKEKTKNRQAKLWGF